MSAATFSIHRESCREGGGWLIEMGHGLDIRDQELQDL